MSLALRENCTVSRQCLYRLVDLSSGRPFSLRLVPLMTMPDPTDTAAQEQIARDQVMQTQAIDHGPSEISRVEHPNERDLSSDAQGLIHLRRDTSNLILNDIYVNPDAAYDRNAQLNSEERQSLSSKPELLGELKPGSSLSSQKAEALGEVSRSYQNSPQTAQEEENGFLDQQRAHTVQQESMSRERAGRNNEQTGPAHAINMDLNRAATSTHQAVGI